MNDMETSILPGADGGSTDEADLIKDTTTASFTADVIEASRVCPVLLDFWSPSCGPCKELGPLLEKIVKEAKGALRLVKMNVDESPAIASQMGVQSIPAVFAFKDGRPVDGFMGALPEGQIRAFIEKALGADALGGMGGVAEVLETALSVYEDGDFAGAAEVYEAILGEEQSNLEAIAGLVKCYIALGEFDRAEETLAQTPAEHLTTSVISSVQAALAVARKGGQGGGDIDALKSLLEANPNDHQARYDLALALHSAGDKENAMDQLFDIMARQRAWNDNAAQKQLVELFVAWGPEDDCTIEGRRRLSSILFV